MPLKQTEGCQAQDAEVDEHFRRPDRESSVNGCLGASWYPEARVTITTVPAPGEAPRRLYSRLTRGQLPSGKLTVMRGPRRRERSTTMMKVCGETVGDWREAMTTWRQTGDVSALVEVAADMDPAWRRVFLDAIIPTGLRQDLEALLRRRAAQMTGSRGG